jgi:uncharacterized membrane protein
MKERERILDIQARTRLAKHYRETREGLEKDEDDMRNIIKVICSPVLTMILFIVIAALWTDILKADELPTPQEGAGCQYEGRINCGE